MKYASYLIVVLYLLCLGNTSIKAQQVEKSDFHRIFGESKLQKYGADTLIGSSNRKVIYSGAQHKITGYNKKGRQIWSRAITEKEGGLIAFMLVQPLDRRNSNKRFEVYLQFKDKTAHAVNIKTGKFKILEL